MEQKRADLINSTDGTKSKEMFIHGNEEPPVLISLREIARCSNLDGQEYDRCT